MLATTASACRRALLHEMPVAGVQVAHGRHEGDAPACGTQPSDF